MILQLAQPRHVSYQVVLHIMKSDASA